MRLIFYFGATTFSFSTREDDKDIAIDEREEREEGASGKDREKQVDGVVEVASEAKGLRKLRVMKSQLESRLTFH